MTSIEEYLSKNEEIRLQWGGELKQTADVSGFMNQIQNSDSTQTTFAATTKRLLLLNNQGGFKDIDNSHISSVEVDKSTEPDIRPRQIIAISGLVLIIIGLLIGIIVAVAAISSGSIILALVGGGILVICGVISLKAWKWAESRRELLGLQEKSMYEVKVITGDEAHQRIEFETEENVGAALSQIVRE